MAKNTNRLEIDSLSFEVEKQELSAQSEASGTQLFKMTVAGLCGLCFTYSYEYTRNNVRC